MSVLTLYRADSRSISDIAKAGGFKSWQNTTVEQARAIGKMFMGDGIENIPEAIKEHLRTKNKQGATNTIKNTKDMSTYIKYTKDRSTSWVSAARNDNCGGQSGGAPIYKITVDASPFKINREKKLEGMIGYSPVTPALLLDNENIDQANVVALRHGPEDDYEVSFFTPIPMNAISLHKGGK